MLQQQLLDLRQQVIKKASNHINHLRINQILYVLFFIQEYLFKFFQSISPLKMRPTTTTNKFSSENQPNFSQTMKKVLVLTQLYTFLLLTCGTKSMQKKPNQPTPNMKKDIVAKKHFGYKIISSYKFLNPFFQ
jgi:hypothetical protein